MPGSLLRLADSEGIAVECWDFEPPLEAVYWSGTPPVIGLDRSMINNRAHLRCVLAEELGHHFTTAGDVIPMTYFHYRDRLLIDRAEHQALRWAALYLMPSDNLQQAFQRGVRNPWDLAECFDVTTDLVDFRLRLSDGLTRAGGVR